jgi:predicted nucleotidyltransferase
LRLFDDQKRVCLVRSYGDSVIFGGMETLTIKQLPPEVARHSDRIQSLCKKHNVHSLYVFGSITGPQFTPHSDIDFLVKFGEVDPLEYFDNHMDFKEGLEALFSRKIDLLEMQTLKNPILKRSVNRNKLLVYGRKNTKVAI